ncbi:MAG TPA: peptidoglycan-binding protein [Novosphingobium sp.]|nr:peptidoglycan-binding protein [Novosphingobium sp.]
MTAPNLVKARLIEMKEDLKTELPVAEGGKAIDVQFNPDSMKVSFANQLAQPSGGDQSAGTSGMQFVGAGTTKLALTLWFDVTQPSKTPVDDVRRMTRDVIHFITPKDGKKDPKKKVPPAARFVWGSFVFDGMMESLEESLEFFSPEGKPLRASVAISLSQQKILVSRFEGPGNAPARPGQRPMTAAKQGDSIQDLVAKQGGGGATPGGAPGSPAGGGDWQSVAAGNGIEDPLRLQPGVLVDLNLRAEVSGGFGAGGGAASPPAIGASLPVATIAIQPPRARLGLN